MEHNYYTLNIYPKSQADLDDIVRYIAQELCNPDAAVKLTADIDDALDLVSRNPKMCPLVKSSYIKDKTIRKLSVKNYLIFYRPDDRLREIQIIRILYGMRNCEDIL